MLLLTGLNHRTTPVELREQCYIGAEQLPSLLFHLRQLPGLEEAVVISTCNRLEVYAVVRGAAAMVEPIEQAICSYYHLNYDTIAPHLYVEQDTRAVEHLMRVACGLDSMILGESQILGQVRDALNAADAAGAAGVNLHRLFEMAIRTGKRAHTETAIGEHTTSVSHAAARLVMDYTTPAADVLIVGTGEMAILAAQALVDRGYCNLHVINRTYANACDLAARVGGQAHEWSFLWERMKQADAVISATGAPHMVLYADDMRHTTGARSGAPLIMVDIAMPRDIEPAINDLPGVYVYDIDKLQDVVDENIAQRQAAVPQVETIVGEETCRYINWHHARSVTPVIKDLRREVQNVVQAELDEALSKLDTLGTNEQAIIRRMAHRIMNKVLHAPTVSLRAHAASGDAETITQLVRELFALIPEKEA